MFLSHKHIEELQWQSEETHANNSLVGAMHSRDIFLEYSNSILVTRVRCLVFLLSQKIKC